LRIAPTMVFSASEVLTSDMRTTIENAFGQVLFNEYAATETGSIAGECPYHTGLHLMEDHIYVEVVDGQNQPVAEGQYGDKLLLSVLFNKTQPLIRYELSDSIKLSQQACPCGRPFLLIADIQGRREDFLYFQGVGREPITIHPLKIDAMMEKVPVTAWQIVLEGKVLTILLAGKDPDYDANGVKTSFEALAENEGIPSLEVLVKEVDAIPKTYSGKAPLIRNLNLKIPSSV
jgi:phenylacetate-CoA ligase